MNWRGVGASILLPAALLLIYDTAAAPVGQQSTAPAQVAIGALELVTEQAGKSPTRSTAIESDADQVREARVDPEDQNPESLLRHRIATVVENVDNLGCAHFPKTRITQSDEPSCDAATLVFIADLAGMCDAEPPEAVERTLWEYERKVASDQYTYHQHLQRLRESHSALLNQYHSDFANCTSFGDYQLSNQRSLVYRELAARLGHLPSLENYVVNAIAAFQSRRSAESGSQVHEVYPFDPSVLQDPGLNAQVLGVLGDLAAAEPEIAKRQLQLFRAMQGQFL